MLRPYRIVAALVLCTVGGSMGVSRATERRSAVEPEAPPSLLATAFAAAVDVPHADTLRSGETLSELMERTRLDVEAARALLAELTRVQDPRRIRPGLVVEYRTATRDGSVRMMGTRLDADRSLDFARGDAGWTAEVREVAVRADTAVLTGRVRQSLYQAMMEAEGDIPRDERGRVVDLLADRIFAWKIDFSRDLRPDDSFRILYERMVRPDGTARSGKILAVELDLNGRRHDAFLFSANGSEDYFDRDGESLRRAFLRAPLEFRRISSAYSNGRFHPVLKRVRPHNGIDYAAAAGTPIRAVGDGTVTRAGWGGGYGNVVEIRHQRGYSSLYAHMRGFAPGVRAGSRVKQGDLIGYVGSTGMSTGPHLHYEFHVNGRPVNPTSVRYLTGDPVPGGSLGRFRSLRDQRIASMERVAGPLLAAGSGGDDDEGREDG
jgi:murein DD-endopeptidase MepM/ murein hydrolase activator NlpD